MGEHGDSGGKQWHHFVAGIAAGASLVIVGYPMDTLKVRQQTGVSKTGVFRAAAQAFRQEGFFGFYRGVLSPLTGVPPQYAISFGTRMVASQFLPMDPNSTAAAYISGGISGFTTTVVTTPVELLKARLQILRDRGGGGAKDTWAAWNVAKSSGFKGMYRGFGVTLLRDVPGSAIYYGAYHWAREMLGGNNITIPGTLLAGGFGGVAAWSVLFPVDLVKSRIQTHDPNAPKQKAWDIVKLIVRTEGVRGLYRGLTASLIRAFPADAAAFLGYEMAMKGLRNMDPV